MTVWMVRSGSGGRWADECREESLVGIGWQEVGDPNRFATKADLQSAVAATYPEYTEGQSASGASQLWRFRNELQVGDWVITYDSGARAYYLGKIASDAWFSPDSVDELAYRRNVEWNANSINRDDLSDDARNRLGSVLTLFKVPHRTAEELLAKSTGCAVATDSEPTIAEEESDPFASVSEEAKLRIADSIAHLDWREMQELVGALLRAMDYKTEISPDGPDRGRDLVASPDGFGFEQPRIVVEVKHRKGEKIDAPGLRAFIGGRHKDDRGLYVSTGGVTKDAYYEADRANIPLKLMTLDDLAEAVIKHYDKFDNEGKALLPLKRFYWPA